MCYKNLLLLQMMQIQLPNILILPLSDVLREKKLAKEALIEETIRRTLKDASDREGRRRRQHTAPDADEVGPQQRQTLSHRSPEEGAPANQKLRRHCEDVF